MCSGLVAGGIRPMDGVDLHPIILVNLGPGGGWAASVLWCWEKLTLSDVTAESLPCVGSFITTCWARKG